MTTQKPSRLWYFSQAVQLTFAGLSDKTARPKSQGVLKRSGTSAAVMAAGSIAAKYLWLIPFVGWGAPVAGLVGGAIFAVKAKNQYKALRNTAYGTRFMRDRLNAWQAKRAEGTFWQRTGRAIKLGTAKLFRGLGCAVGVAGLGLGVTGGLHLGGVIAANVVTTTMAGVAAGFGLTAAAALPVAIGMAVAAAAIGTVTAIKSHRAVIATRGAKKTFSSYIKPTLGDEATGYKAGGASAAPKQKKGNGFLDSLPAHLRDKLGGNGFVSKDRDLSGDLSGDFSAARDQRPPAESPVGATTRPGNTAFKI